MITTKTWSHAVSAGDEQIRHAATVSGEMAGSGWRDSAQGRAARWSGVGLAMMFGVFGIQRRDGEAVAFALLTLVATALTLIGRGLPGRIALGFVALDTVAWLAPAAVVNASSGEALVDVGVPTLLCVLALVVVLLVFGGPPKPVFVVGSLLLAGSLGLSVVASGRGISDVPETKVTTKNMAFSPGSVPVRSGGSLGVRNSDLFWHSFTVPDLDIDARVPTGATRLVRIEAPPGSYRFVCAIPGHEQAGMHGVLIVR